MESSNVGWESRPHHRNTVVVVGTRGSVGGGESLLVGGLGGREGRVVVDRRTMYDADLLIAGRRKMSRMAISAEVEEVLWLY